MAYDGSAAEERRLCREISSTGVEFCELPLSGLVGVIDVELDRTGGMSEHVAVAYDYGRRGYGDETYEADWSAVKEHVEREHPDAPWVKIGLDDPWPGEERDAATALLEWADDGLSVGEFARKYGPLYPPAARDHLASRIVNATAALRNERAGDPQTSFKALFSEYQSLSGWQGLDAEDAVETFARFCAEEFEKHADEHDAPSRRNELRVKTDLGDLVARFSGDLGVYDGICIDLEKPDGTSGQIAVVESVPESDVESGIYGSRMHTLAWDGNNEDEPSRIDVDIDGEAMQYAFRDADGSIGRPSKSAEGIDRSSFIDPKGRVVLMTFEVPGRKFPDALIFSPGTVAPFIAASGYDPATGEWSHGWYSSDPADAYFHANPEIIEESAVVWSHEDVAAALRNAGAEPTSRNVGEVLYETRNMKWWKEGAIQDGNELLAGCAAAVSKISEQSSCLDAEVRDMSAARSAGAAGSFRENAPKEPGR